jgi:hypothetical protein
MTTNYASFGIPRTKWLLYMHPLEFQGARSVKHFAKKPLCTSTYGAQTFVKFCTQTIVERPHGELSYYLINRLHNILSCYIIFYHVGLC